MKRILFQEDSITDCGRARESAAHLGTYWLQDGVHPTAMGHELIKREWIKAFKKF